MTPTGFVSVVELDVRQQKVIQFELHNHIGIKNGRSAFSRHIDVLASVTDGTYTIGVQV